MRILNLRLHPLSPEIVCIVGKTQRSYPSERFLAFQGSDAVWAHLRLHQPLQKGHPSLYGGHDEGQGGNGSESVRDDGQGCDLVGPSGGCAGTSRDSLFRNGRQARIFHGSKVGKACS